MPQADGETLDARIRTIIGEATGHILGVFAREHGLTEEEAMTLLNETEDELGHHTADVIRQVMECISGNPRT